MTNYYDAHLSYILDICKLSKEHNIRLVELHQDGKLKRIEFNSEPQLVEFVPGELPKDGTTEPSPVESAALRLAGRAKKAGAK